MGSIVESVKSIEIDYQTLKNVVNYIPVYHKEEDTLYLQPIEPKQAVSFDWNGDIWFRLNPDNGEIVGVEIEDFESVFLPKYPNLKSAWEDIKPLCQHKKKSITEGRSAKAFLTIILEFLRSLLRDKPQQAELAV